MELSPLAASPFPSVVVSVNNVVGTKTATCDLQQTLDRRSISANVNHSKDVFGRRWLCGSGGSGRVIGRSCSGEASKGFSSLFMSRNSTEL